MNNYLVFMPEEMQKLLYPLFEPGYYKKNKTPLYNSNIYI
jgi:hypothetical protein